jgi:hypothetical protein
MPSPPELTSADDSYEPDADELEAMRDSEAIFRQEHDLGLAAGVSAFELARIMGTSVRIIERHYGTLRQDSGDAIRGKLDVYLDRLGQELPTGETAEGAPAT